MANGKSHEVLSFVPYVGYTIKCSKHGKNMFPWPTPNTPFSVTHTNLGSHFEDWGYEIVSPTLIFV